MFLNNQFLAWSHYLSWGIIDVEFNCFEYRNALRIEWLIEDLLL